MTSILLSIGLIQEYLENLIVFKKFPAVLNHSLDSTVINSKRASVFKLFYSTPLIWVLVILQLCLSVIFLLTNVFYQVFYLVPLGILLLDILTFFRLRYLPSSYKPLQRIFLLAIVVHYYFEQEEISQLSILVIAAFLSLAYVAAGYQKLISIEWKAGKIMRELFNETKLDFLKNVKFLKCMGYLVILFEISFPFAFYNFISLSVYLIAGVGFHVFLYIKYHYSFFFWTFISGYFAVIYLVENGIEFYFYTLSK